MKKLEGYIEALTDALSSMTKEMVAEQQFYRKN
jgi:hypothetical protein